MPLCPCCGDETLSAQQIRRHLAERQRRLADTLDALNAMEEDDAKPRPLNAGLAFHDNPVPQNENPPPRGNSPALDEIEGVLGGARQRGIDLAALIMMENDYGDEMDLDDDNIDDDEDNLFAPPPEMPVLPVPAVHQIPPAVIDDWASDDEPADFEPPDRDIDGESVGSADRDPEFEEDDGIRGLNADAEPDMEDEELWAFLQQHLGDLAREEWIDIYDRFITDQDRVTLKFLAAHLRTHFSRATYEDLRLNACEELGLSSDFVAWRRLKVLSDLHARKYDCCIDSCCCFVGKHANLNACPFCHSPRYNAAGKPRRSFHYTPLIPQLHSLFQNPDSIKNLRHRVRHDEHRARHPGKVTDVFDGEIYQTLRNTRVHEEHEYRYFDNPDDIALGLGTDGFNMYKRRHKGHSTAWPLILVNYNLHPSIRTRLENILCVGVIPGPRECKDINSYLVPLVEELLQLADGIELSKVNSEMDNLDDDGTKFTLRAFLIILFGDILAISKMLMLKGHNGIMPCRACLIEGTRCQLPATVVYYVPLTAPDDPEVFPPEDLLMRTHQSFLFYFDQLSRAQQDGERLRISRECGLNGRPVVARLGSINLAACAPYELMHLIFENLVPNMVMHWKGIFKWLDQEDEVYRINNNEWEIIGRLTTEAARTIPSAFVGTLPNIHTDPGLYKAEANSFWFTYLAPILLNGRLDHEYYEHFLAMREIIIWCLELEITHEQVDALERMINEWVGEYERLYYRYEHDRLPTCVLTIHALLHIPYYIRQTGPLSCTWSFVMERFCGYLLRPALANRVRPYEYLDNFIRRRAQMQIVSVVHNMPSLVRPLSNLTLRLGELISSKETIYDAFPNYILGQPVNSRYHITEQLKRQMTRYFGLAEGPEHGQGPRLTYQQLLDRIDWNTLVRHGRFRIASMGDRVRVADLIQTDPIARDNSFVRYELLPDRNAERPNEADQPMRVTYYGRVQDVFYVEYIRDPMTNQREPYLLARVQECNTMGLDATRPENPIVTYNRLASPEIIHLGSVLAVVGRVKVGGRNIWAIVDRSRGARTQFNNDEGLPDADIE